MTRVRLAAALVFVGLAVELGSLHWAHPTAFIVFAAVSGLAIGAGVVLFLTTLFRTGPA